MADTKETAKKVDPADLALSERTEKLVESMKGTIKVDPNGQVTVEKGLYEKYIPDGLTSDMIKKVTSYNHDFLAASVKIFADQAVKVAAGGKVPATQRGDGEVTQITATIPLLGHDRAKVTYTHQQERSNIGGEKDANGKLPKITSYGDVDVTVRTSWSNKRTGDLKRILASVKADAAKSAKKK